MRGWIIGAALLAAFAGGFAVAQGVGQSGREPQFDNSEVKVWKSVVMPHAPLPLHRHEHPRVIIALAGGTMQIVEKSGSRETHDWQTGHAYWLPSNPPGTLHQDVNIGDKPIEVMVVELEKES
jgi:quercetin dioxygenase-like cupin family protein